MANGDAAAAAGMDVVAGTADLRMAYDEINKSRDYTAAHQTTGTHPASAITSGVLDAARIPAISVAVSQVNAGVWTGTVTGGGNAVTGGNAAFSGYVQAGGNVEATGLVKSVAGKAYTVVGSWVAAAFQQSDGTIGIQPSARRFKKNIKPWTEDVDKFLNLVPRKGNFVWEKKGTPPRAFLIAEELVEAGFEEMVPLDVDPESETFGQPLTINYADLTVPLLMVARAQRDQIAALTARLEALEGKVL